MVEYSGVLNYSTEYTPRRPRSSDQTLRGDFSWQPQRTCSGIPEFTSATSATHTVNTAEITSFALACWLCFTTKQSWIVRKSMSALISAGHTAWNTYFDSII